MRKFTLSLFIGLLVVSMTGCGNTTNDNQISDSGAKQAQSSTVAKYRNGDTYEQWSIDNRTLVTNDPAKIMWIHLLNMEGKPIEGGRMPVRCKVTSSGKSLVPKHIVVRETTNATGDLPKYITKDGTTYYTNELMGPDGAFGSSGEYTYWFDPLGRYHQIGSFGQGSMCYLLTDYPIDLEDPTDKISGLFKMDQMAGEWQEQQEVTLAAEVEKFKPTNE